MAEPWMTANVRINVVGAWLAYANAHPGADDVKMVHDLYVGGRGLWKAITDPGSRSAWLIPGLVSVVTGDVGLKGMATLDAMKIPYNSVDVVDFNVNQLGPAIVQRQRPDGSMVNTALTDWEKYSLILKKFADFDPTNFPAFLKQAIQSGEALSNAEKALLDKLGIKVDLILEADLAELQARYPQLHLPPELQQKTGDQDSVYRTTELFSGRDTDLAGGRHAADDRNAEGRRHGHGVFADQWRASARAGDKAFYERHPGVDHSSMERRVRRGP